MDFLHLARKRYSTRQFDSKTVEPDKLSRILEAGRIAPSAANYQPWYFIVITEIEQRKKFWSVYQQPWFMDARVYIVLCADHNTSWKRSDGKDHSDIDIAIAADHMTLAATEIGLGTCWICHFDVAACRKILNLPDYIEPVVILPVGYPLDSGNPNRHTNERKQIAAVVYYERFGNAMK